MDSGLSVIKLSSLGSYDEEISPGSTKGQREKKNPKLEKMRSQIKGTQFPFPAVD